MSRYTAGMHRRTFLGTVSAALRSAPLAAKAQQTAAMRRVGILGNVPLSDPGSRYLWGEFTQSMKDLGYVDGQNISIDYVSSDGRYERLPALAAELVRRKAEVIVAPAVQNVVAAKQASATTPIVMASVGDPVGNGLIASLAHPGGTVTGTSFVTSLIVGKQLELLKQITPPVVLLALLLNPANPGHPLLLREAQAVAPSLGVQLLQLEVRGPNELDSGFARLSKDRAGALFVPWDGTFLVHLTQIVRLAGRTRLPTLYGQRGYVAAGGFVSYGPSAPEAFRRAASYVDKILKGAAPGDLPIEQPTKFELVINLKTAKALGLTIPQSLLLRADHVIQ